MSTNNGGPAFGGKVLVSSVNVYGRPTGGTEYVDTTGMSLRDYFAAKAMQGDCCRNEWERHNLDDLASWAYLVADAMIAAREAK